MRNTTAKAELPGATRQNARSETLSESHAQAQIGTSRTSPTRRRSTFRNAVPRYHERPEHWIRSAGCWALGEFCSSPGGERELLAWLGGFGHVERVGVEAPVRMGRAWDGSSRRPASRWSRSTGRTVKRVIVGGSPTRWMRSKRPAPRRRTRGGAAKSRDGNVEAIRALMVAKRSARFGADQDPQSDPSFELHRTRGTTGPLQGHLVASRHRRRRRGATAAPWR